MEGHTFTAWPDALIMCFGGKRGDIYTKDLWQVRITAGEGEKGALWGRASNPGGRSPAARAYHTATLWRKRFMIVVGGVGANASGAFEGEPESGFESVFWMYDRTNGWRMQAAQGDVPRRRCHHSTVVDTQNDSLYLYGGYPVGPESERLLATVEGTSTPKHPGFFDVYELRLGGPNPLWRQIQSHNAPPMMWGHVSVLYSTNLIVHAGVDVVDGKESKTVCVWHTQRHEWRWVDFTKAPEPRALHSGVVLPGTDRVFVFGGFGGVNTLKHNDTWTFSCESGQWSPMPSAGPFAIAPRSGHASCIITSPKKLLVVHGGVGSSGSVLSDSHVLDLETGAWAPLKPSETSEPLAFLASTSQPSHTTDTTPHASDALLSNAHRQDSSLTSVSGAVGGGGGGGVAPLGSAVGVDPTARGYPSDVDRVASHPNRLPPNLAAPQRTDFGHLPPAPGSHPAAHARYHPLPATAAPGSDVRASHSAYPGGVAEPSVSAVSTAPVHQPILPPSVVSGGGSGPPPRPMQTPPRVGGGGDPLYPHSHPPPPPPRGPLHSDPSAVVPHHDDTQSVVEPRAAVAVPQPSPVGVGGGGVPRPDRVGVELTFTRALDNDFVRKTIAGHLAHPADRVVVDGAWKSGAQRCNVSILPRDVYTQNVYELSEELLRRCVRPGDPLRAALPGIEAAAPLGFGGDAAAHPVTHPAAPAHAIIPHNDATTRASRSQTPTKNGLPIQVSNYPLELDQVVPWSDDVRHIQTYHQPRPAEEPPAPPPAPQGTTASQACQTRVDPEGLDASAEAAIIAAQRHQIEQLQQRIREAERNKPPPSSVTGYLHIPDDRDVGDAPCLSASTPRGPDVILTKTTLADLLPTIASTATPPLERLGVNTLTEGARKHVTRSTIAATAERRAATEGPGLSFVDPSLLPTMGDGGAPGGATGLPPAQAVQLPKPPPPRRVVPSNVKTGKSPSLKSIIGGQASMLSITHLVGRDAKVPAPFVPP